MKEAIFILLSTTFPFVLVALVLIICRNFRLQEDIARLSAERKRWQENALGYFSKFCQAQARIQELEAARRQGPQPEEAKPEEVFD